MTTTDLTRQKIEEINEELKKTGLWKKQTPVWVTDYQKKAITDEQDFLDWLQFIYLPNCPGPSAGRGNHLIVPQAARFFADDMKKGRLLQLLIELDALL